MKKMLFLLLLLPTLLIAQKTIDRPECVIDGPLVLTVGEPATFSTNAVAQCNQCYDWDINSFGSIASIQGDDRNDTVTIMPTGEGSFALKLTYLTEYGCKMCTRNVIIEAASACDFEPEFTTKFDCSPQGTGRVFMTNTDFSEVDKVTYNFEANNNIFNGQTYYDGFQFDGGGTGIQVSSEPFLATFSYQPADCRPDDIITLNVTIEFVDGSECDTIAEVYDIDVFDNGGQLTRVFPNPATTSVNVDLSNFEGRKISLQLYDLSGNLKDTKEVQTINDSNKLVNFSLLNIDSEMMFIRIIENNLVLETRKVIVK